MTLLDVVSLALLIPASAQLVRHHRRTRRQRAFYLAYNEACRPYHTVL